ncbi:MAG: hypothetical protein ACOX3K_01940 [Bacilli bacterium]
MKKNIFKNLIVLGVAVAVFAGVATPKTETVKVKAAATTNTTNAVYVSQITGWPAYNRHSGVNFTLDTGSKVTPTVNTAIAIDCENLATWETYVSFYLNGFDTAANRLNSTNHTPPGEMYLFNDATHVVTYQVSTGTADIKMQNNLYPTYNKMVIKLSHFNGVFTEGVETNLNSLFYATRLNIVASDPTRADFNCYIKGMYVFEFAGAEAPLDLSGATKIYTPAANNFDSRSGNNQTIALALQGEYVTPATFDISGDANGTLEMAGGAYIGHGTDLLVVPNANYILKKLLVDSIDVTTSVVNNRYHIDAFTSATFVATAEFELFTAVKFAQEFIGTTGPVCSAAGDDHLTELQAAWPELVSRYSILSAEEKTAFADPAATNTDIQNAVARYKFICGKYNTETIKNLEEFAAEIVVVYSVSPLVELFHNETSTGVSVVLIFIAFISIYAFYVLVTKRRRKNINQ